MIGFLYGSAYLFSIKALKLVNASTVAIFSSLEPALCILFNICGIIVKKREKYDWKIIVSMLMVLIGAIISQINPDNLSGILNAGVSFVMLSALCFAIGVLISDRIISDINGGNSNQPEDINNKNTVSLIIVSFALFIGGIFLLAYSMFNDGSRVIYYKLNIWGLIVIASLCVALSWMFFYKSLSRLHSAITESLYQTKVPFTFLLSFVFIYFGFLYLKPIPHPFITLLGIVILITSSVLLTIFHLKIKNKEKNYE